MRGLAFVIRFEYALSRDEEEEAEEVFGEARGCSDGVGVGDMLGLSDEARGEGTLGSRGERDRRSGDEERGEEIAGM